MPEENKQKIYEEFDAKPVLARLEGMIADGCSRRTRDVCGKLSIFDWWHERLSVSNMKLMRTFLREAIKLGYTGYVCFKVGASGCANGMWAYKERTTTGYSPKCDAIYRSFSPNYTYWSFCKGGEWFPSSEAGYDSLKTAKMLEKALMNA